MLLDNYYTLLYNTLLVDNTKLMTNWDGIKVVCTSYNAEMIRFSVDASRYPSMHRQFPAVVESPYYGGVILGTGDTPVASTDYWLENYISADIVTMTNESVNTFWDDSGKTIMGMYTLTNNTDSDVVIKEVGLVCWPDGRNIGDSTQYVWRILVDRTVLQNPITVPANGTARMVYAIQYL